MARTYHLSIYKLIHINLGYLEDYLKKKKTLKIELRELIKPL